LWNRTGQWDLGCHDAAGQLGVAGSAIEQLGFAEDQVAQLEDWVPVGTEVVAPLEEQVVHLGEGSVTALLEEQGALAVPLEEQVGEHGQVAPMEGMIPVGSYTDCSLGGAVHSFGGI